MTSSVRRPRAARSPRWQADTAAAGPARAAKKHAILRAAAALLRERGYEHTRLIDIAAALNVTKPALYYYVRSKEDILVEIQQTGLDEITDELNRLRRAELTGAEVLRRVVARYASWVTGEFGACVMRHFLVRLSADNMARLRRARRAVDSRIRATVARGIDDGSLRPCEPWVVSSAIVGAVSWMAYWYEACAGRRTPAELGEAYFDLLLEGIGAGARGARPMPPADEGNSGCDRVLPVGKVRRTRQR